MKSTEPTDELSTSPTVLRRVIDLCDRFEAEWCADSALPIEHYLSNIPAQDQYAVFQRLLGLEIELRNARGQRPALAEYLRRFPTQSEEIYSVFREAGLLESSPAVNDRGLGADHRPAGGLGTAPWRSQSRQESTEQAPDCTGTCPNQALDLPSEATASEPRVLAERYTLVRLHAEGGFGQVWVARDHHLDREIALKKLQPLTAFSPIVRARFLREARVTGQLQHPGVAAVHELWGSQQGPEPFYTMRFINGRTLTEAARDYHRRRQAGAAQALQLRELIRALQSVCQVLAYAHSRGVIHRDIKGQNVVLGDFGEVMVLDWGLAKVVGGEITATELEEDLPASIPINDPVDKSWDETAQGEIVGTPSYMSPEQAMGRVDLVDRRSDIYGLGAILYEILTGEPPFRGTRSEVLQRVTDELPVSPRRRIPSLSPAIEAICLKSLAKAPVDRYATAADLAKDLERYLADEPVTAYEEPWTAKPKRWISRHRTLAVTVTATLLVATIILSAAMVAQRLANDREARAHGKAKQNLQLAVAAVNRFFSDFGEDPRLKAHGLEKPRQALLLLAKDFYEVLARENDQDPNVEVQRGHSYIRLAKLSEDLGEADAAIPWSEEACRIFEKLARQNPNVPAYREGVARGLDSLAGNYAATNQPAKAREAFEKSVDVWEHLSRDFAQVPLHRYHTGMTLNRLGRLLGMVLRNKTACDRAVTRSLSLCERLVEERPEVPEFRNEQAEAKLLLGSMRAYTGQLSAGKELLSEALAIREKLTADHPDILDYQSSLVDTCVVIASAYSNAREPGPVMYAKIRSISERLARVHPDVTLFAENHCLIEVLYLIHLAQSGDHEHAAAAVERVVAEAPKSAMAMLYAACCYSVAAEAARRDPKLQGSERKSAPTATWIRRWSTCVRREIRAYSDSLSSSWASSSSTPTWPRSGTVRISRSSSPKSSLRCPCRPLEPAGVDLSALPCRRGSGPFDQQGPLPAGKISRNWHVPRAIPVHRVGVRRLDDILRCVLHRLLFEERDLLRHNWVNQIIKSKNLFINEVPAHSHVCILVAEVIAGHHANTGIEGRVPGITACQRGAVERKDQCKRAWAESTERDRQRFRSSRPEPTGRCDADSMLQRRAGVDQRECCGGDLLEPPRRNDKLIFPEPHGHIPARRQASLADQNGNRARVANVAVNSTVVGRDRDRRIRLRQDVEKAG